MDLWDQIKSYLPSLGLGIPQGEIKNAQGDVVFPTNAVERGLQGSDAATKDYAAAFLGAPGLKLPPISGPIRAYHGSPYDFNKFDASHIGSGEGAQAYGHGLYFAENPEVARSYKQPVKSFSDLTVEGKPYDPKNPVHIAAWYKSQLATNPQAELNLMEPAHQKAYDLLQSGAKLPDVGGAGRMYEVNINARPEQFLQWDKPIAQQPEAVQRLAAQFRMPEYRTGADFYGGVRGGNQPAATERLAQEGIPGIRYLDQFSRNIAKEKPSPTSNYVVFNPAIVDILKKYGIAGMLGGSMLGAPQNNQPTLGFQ